MSLNISPAKDGVPIGSYILFSNTRPNEVNAEGKTYLKAGVIAPSSQYPDVPSDFTDYLCPLTPSSLTIGDACISDLTLDTFSGAVYAAENGKAATFDSSNTFPRNGIATIKGLSSTNFSDVDYSRVHMGGTGSVQKTRLLRFWNGRVFIFTDDHVTSASNYNDIVSVSPGSFNINNSYTSVLSNPTAIGAFSFRFSDVEFQGNTGIAVFINRDGVTNTNRYCISTNNGNTWTIATTNLFPVSGQYTGIAFNSTLNIWVTIASGGTVALSSTNGTTWTQRTLPSTQSWAAVASNSSAGEFIAIASNTTSAARSTDGLTWSAISLPTSVDWAKIEYSNSMWIAIARNTNIYATSTNGTTWTQRTLPVTALWSSVVYSSTIGAWFIASDDGKGVYSSPDAVTWTKKNTSNIGIKTWSRLWVNGANIYAIKFGLRNSNFVEYAKSTDSGATWKRWFRQEGSYQLYEYLNNTFIKTSNTNSTTVSTETSTDFETWTGITGTLGDATNGLTGIIWTGSKYILTSYYYGFSGGWLPTSFVYETTNFVTFTNRSLGVNGLWSNIGMMGTNIIVLGNIDQGTTGYGRVSTNNGVSWSAITNYDSINYGTYYGNANSARQGYDPISGIGYIVFLYSIGGTTWALGIYSTLDKGVSAIRDTSTVIPDLVAREFVDDHKVVYMGDDTYSYQGYTSGGAYSTKVYSGPSSNYITTKYSYVSAYNTVMNAAVKGLYAQPVTIGSTKYFLCSNLYYYDTLLKIGTEKYIDNSNTATAGNLTYYMRVK